MYNNITISSSTHLLHRDSGIRSMILQMSQLVPKQQQAYNLQYSDNDCRVESKVLSNEYQPATLLARFEWLPLTICTHIDLNVILPAFILVCEHDHDQSDQFGARISSCDLKYAAAAIHNAIPSIEVAKTEKVWNRDSRRRLI
jgi:hypothetical protein